MSNRRSNSPLRWFPRRSDSGGGLSVLIALIIGFSMGFASASKLQPIKLESTITTPQLPMAASVDMDVRIDYQGIKGRRFTGVYWVTTPSDGIKEQHISRDIEGELPKSVTFRIRSDAYIAASMRTSVAPNGVVKIFKNGRECNYDRVEGYDHGKACSAGG